MKKYLPYLALAAFTFTMVAPHSAHALLPLVGDLLDGNNNGAPEIDPSALGSAIALVMGGAAMLTDRFRR